MGRVEQRIFASHDLIPIASRVADLLPDPLTEGVFGTFSEEWLQYLVDNQEQ